MTLDGSDALKDDFMAAVRAGELDAARDFLDKGVDVETKTYGGRTALMTAAANGHDELLTLLLQRGAAVNATNDSGASVNASRRSQQQPSSQVPRRSTGRR